MTKVVVDTNVIISGILGKQARKKDDSSFAILRWLEARHFLLMMNGKIMDEYQRKLDQKVADHTLLGADIGHYLKLIREVGVFGRMFAEPMIYIPQDPSDNIYFLSSNCITADYIVTGNHKHFTDVQSDLVSLGSKLKVISPHDFVQQIRS